MAGADGEGGRRSSKMGGKMEEKIILNEKIDFLCSTDFK
jgi:hypothetical protein